MNKSFIQSVLMILLATGLIGQAFAAGLPSGYPELEEFNSVGTIDSAVYDNRIVIGDEEFLVAKNIIVVTPNKKGGSLKDLRQGRTAGIFATTGTLEQRAIVTEIWMFPRNYR